MRLVRYVVPVRQVGLESESLEAARATKPLGAGVGLNVRSKVGTVGERLSTQSTGKRFLSRMGSFHLNCLLTWIGFRHRLSRMGSLVSAKQPRPRERLIARRAAVLEVVCEEVHGQRRHGDVHFPAVRAGPGVLAVDAAVGLLVTGEVRRRGVATVTLIARVLRPRRRRSSPGRRRRGRRTDRGRRRRGRGRRAGFPPTSVAAVDEEGGRQSGRC